jgi:hypothetical protein
MNDGTPQAARREEILRWMRRRRLSKAPPTAGNRDGI